MSILLSSDGTSARLKAAQLDTAVSSHPNRTYLVIPGGGRGLRMGGGIAKQFRDWGGIPLLKATLQAFLVAEMPPLDGISLAVPEERLAEVKAWDLGLPLFVTVGGETRQESVALALKMLPEEDASSDARVMIHDAVRPFPPAQAIHEALSALSGWDACVLGEASTDTLKRVDQTFQVIATEPREWIFRAQTPQIATLKTWKTAFDWAEATGFVGTDDVSILEAMGLRVRLIPSPCSNIKLTTPEDWDRYAPVTR